MVTDPHYLVGHEASQLPALYNKVQAELDDYLKKNDVKELDIVEPKLHSLDGARAGRKAGDQIGLDTQVGARPKGVRLEDQSSGKSK
jgi:hypothetical protein